MTYDQEQRRILLSEGIEQLVSRYGSRRVLFATLVALFRRGPARRHPEVGLNDYLRRDIGLPPIDDLPSRPGERFDGE
jgi:hypothetical protein